MRRSGATAARRRRPSDVDLTAVRPVYGRDDHVRSRVSIIISGQTADSSSSSSSSSVVVASSVFLCADMLVISVRCCCVQRSTPILRKTFFANVDRQTVIDFIKEAYFLSTTLVFYSYIYFSRQLTKLPEALCFTSESSSV